MTSATRNSSAELPLSGQRVAFTGRLASMPRTDAIRLVRDAGGEPVAGVSRRTTLLVVGMEGWPMLADGSISGKLKKAEALQATGQAIAILSEPAFLERIGQRSDSGGAQGQTVTVDNAVHILGVGASTVRRWEQFGLVRTRDGGLDFRDLVSLRAIAELVRDGMTPAAIARGLDRLTRVLPDAERPLAQARVLVEAGDLVAELQGARIDTQGQLLLDFSCEDKPEPAVSLPRQASTHEEADAWFAHGLACEVREAWDEAEQAYWRALDLAPEFAEAHFNLGNVLYQQDRLDAAETHYRQAVARDPELADAWYNLGYVLDEQDRVAEAVSALQRALELAPEHADAHFNLGLCFDRLGEHERALHYWRAYLRLEPEGVWAPIARRRLSDIQG